MPARTFETKSVEAFAGVVETMTTATDGPYWFRGCGLSDHTLLPGLYRKKPSLSLAELIELEEELDGRFGLRSLPYTQTNMPLSGWDRLFLMQHSGVPTRLLDWSENPFIALFFALESGVRHDFKDDPTVWALQPTVWNRHALRDTSYSGGVLSPHDHRVRGYASPPDVTMLGDSPLAIYGAHNSPRIVAQRGVFTVFGRRLESMEALFDADRYHERALFRLSIPRAEAADLWTTIQRLGFTDSVIFPDLDGLARELRRHYGFAV